MLMQFSGSSGGCYWSHLSHSNRVGFVYGDSQRRLPSSVAAPGFLRRETTISISKQSTGTNFSYSSTSSTPSPLLLLPNEIDGGKEGYHGDYSGDGLIRYIKDGADRFYSLAEKKMVTLKRPAAGAPAPEARCIGSSLGWLVYINPRDCGLCLYNPISGKTVPLPPFQTLPMMTSFFRLDSHKWNPLALSLELIEKVILSCSPDDNPDDCTVLVIQGTLGNGGKLAFCKVGDSTWTALGGRVEQRNCYTDIIYSPVHELFFASTFFAVQAWDLRNPESPIRKYDTVEFFPLKIEEELKDEWFLEYMYDYLVVEPSSGQLFYILRTINKEQTLLLEVYRIAIDEENDKMIYVRAEEEEYTPCLESIDHLAMFVGLNQSFVLSARDFPPGVLAPNSVYFTASPFLNDDLPDKDMGVYNLGDRTVCPIYPKEVNNIGNLCYRHIWLLPS